MKFINQNNWELGRFGNGRFVFPPFHQELTCLVWSLALLFMVTYYRLRLKSRTAYAQIIALRSVYDCTRVDNQYVPLIIQPRRIE